MELLKKLPTRMSKQGYVVSWGLFLCPYCGQEVEVRLGHGKINKSCGCNRYKREGKHGGSRNGDQTGLYLRWLSMKSRCYYAGHKGYKYYGGRGISVCDEWIEDYAIFREWALNNGYRSDLTIDRIDNNGNYEPDNCRWVTSAVNQQNSNNAKLNINEVRVIRDIHKDGYSKEWLANMFKVSKENIYSIVNYDTWLNE